MRPRRTEAEWAALGARLLAGEGLRALSHSPADTGNVSRALRRRGFVSPLSAGGSRKGRLTRATKLSRPLLVKAILWRARGIEFPAISARLGVGRTTVHQRFKRYGWIDHRGRLRPEVVAAARRVAS